MATLRFLVLVWVLWISFAQASNYPLTLTDDLGREVVLEQAPQRILSMMASHTETLCALGACDLLVGRDTFSNFPPQVLELPDVGTSFGANLELIASLEPDLILMDEASDFATSLSDLGFKVYAGVPQNYDDVFASFITIGQMVDRELAAEMLIQELDLCIEGIHPYLLEEGPSVFFEIDATPYAAGDTSFIGELVARAHGQNIVTNLGDFPQIDPEFIVASDPDIIILADAIYGESTEKLANRPGWHDLSAVKNNRIVELSSEEVDITNRPGPRVGEALSILANIFFPADYPSCKIAAFSQ
ncbi:MAG: ABC transporter substrate-binding protein [Deinococcales bacterium]